MVQRGRAGALTAVCPGSISDWGTNIPQAVHGQKKKKMLWDILWFSDLYPDSFRWTPCPSQFSVWTNQELGCSVKITDSPRHPQGLQLGAQLFPPDHAVSEGTAISSENTGDWAPLSRGGQTRVHTEHGLGQPRGCLWPKLPPALREPGHLGPLPAITKPTPHL